ncbi:peptide/nickel transport system permease protein [Arthrobacter woluwensis]|uniref:ABC transporter permease n=1 Tax=Arthrobacter woluwensis TaxID=156980 RepID=UPI00277FC76E|nr:ABC transporter permease [Arthrobacter woluwensis]MDQ0707462.1 peptide/nickel transport system permease protein [Arthrobacter woluwensis]
MPSSRIAGELRRLLRIPAASISIGLLVFMLLFSFLGPLLTGYTGEEINLRIAEHGPASNHWLGTDEYGRDVLTRLMFAGRISLTIGVASMLLSLLLGAVLGLMAGYYGGIVDTLIMRFADLLMSIPGLPLLIVMAAVLSELKVAPESRIYIVMILLSVIGWPSLARLIRGQVLSLREAPYMRAAEVLGLSAASRQFRHLLPNVMPLLIVVATLSTASGILSESALSFLGLGVVPPNASWGNMINAANNLIDFQQHWWLWVPPGVALLITVAAINVLGDRLRDVLDPRMGR